MQQDGWQENWVVVIDRPNGYLKTGCYPKLETRKATHQGKSRHRMFGRDPPVFVSILNVVYWESRESNQTDSSSKRYEELGYIASIVISFSIQNQNSAGDDYSLQSDVYVWGCCCMSLPLGGASFPTRSLKWKTFYLASCNPAIPDHHIVDALIAIVKNLAADDPASSSILFTPSYSSCAGSQIMAR